MKEIDAVRLKLKAMELVEDTKVDWWCVIKICDSSPWQGELPPHKSMFLWSLESYELALGVIEGKPMWGGDVAYLNGIKVVVSPDNYFRMILSWNPPKPKTIMDEN